MTQDEQQNALIARLDEKINGLEKNINQKLDQILVQTTKTNGRLTKAEDGIQKMNTWKEVKEGQFKVIWVIFLGFVSVISWIISKI